MSQGPLDPATTALVRLAAAVAEGDVSELQERLAAAQGAGVPPLWIDELLLQSMLVVGYPLTLVAFGVWREVAGPTAKGGHAAEPLAHEDWQSWADRGAAVCRAVYGRAYHKLLLNLRALHPALEDLVLVDAYGKVIGRPGLDLKTRTLVCVVSDAATGQDPELAIHLARDQAGTPFLLLTGPEPDHEWERFVTAVSGVTTRLGAELVVGFHGIPMGVPHTRPLGVTAHGTKPDLIVGSRPIVDRLQVPGSAAS